MTETESTHVFVVELGAALHRYGASTARIEEALARLSERLGIDGQFFATPTALFAAFRGGGRTHLARLQPAVVDLGKLTRLDALLTDLLHERVTPAQGMLRLSAILTAPRRPYRRSLLLGGQMLAAAAAGRLVGGGWREIGVAAIIGIACALLAWASERRPRLDRVQTPLASFLAACVAVAAAHWISPLHVQRTEIAGLIVLLPGLTLTIAMTELATGHLASGTARLAGALVVFLTMAFGVAFGSHVAAAVLGPVRSLAPLPLPDWSLAVALTVAPLAMAAMFEAPWREIPFLVLGAVTAYAGALLGQRLLGPELGVFVGGLTVGLAANAYARRRNRPAAVVHVPALLLLVPGTIGFNSVSALLASDVTRGVDIAFATLIMVVALVTGMLVAVVILPPRRAL